MPHNPVIVVFGGTGFIGGNFAAHAAARGSQVVACGTSAPAKNLPGVRFEQLDATDTSAVGAFLTKARPEAIVFCVSRMQPRSGEIDLALALTELRALANVLQAAPACGVQQFVYCSSGGAIYGDGRAPHPETDPTAPKSLYGELKVQAETLSTVLCRRLGLRLAVLRIANPYGPGQSPFGLHGVIPIFTYKMLTAAPITVIGSLDAAKDYMFVDDVSTAIWAAIGQKADGVFNIGSGTTTALHALIRKISDVCAVVPAIEHRDLTAAEVPSFALDVSKASSILQWTPRIDIDAGIRATKDWIENTFLR